MSRSPPSWPCLCRDACQSPPEGSGGGRARRRAAVKSARAVDDLTHRVEAIDRIAMYAPGLTPEIFLQTTLVQDAVVRNFEMIDEAARDIAREAPELTATRSDTIRPVISAMRNRLAHGYFSARI
jgi:uncharacterized protein with HEPN domain